MNVVLFLHVLFACVWVGCVLTQGVLERAGDGSDAIRLFISRAHWRIDQFVEIPAFVIVLLTGAHMWTAVNPNTLIAAMVLVGLVAIVINVYCVHLARMRLKAAEAGDFRRWVEIDGQLHVYGAVLLVAQVAALAIGGNIFVGG